MFVRCSSRLELEEVSHLGEKRYIGIVMGYFMDDQQSGVTIAVIGAVASFIAANIINSYFLSQGMPPSLESSLMIYLAQIVVFFVIYIRGKFKEETG